MASSALEVSCVLHPPHLGCCSEDIVLKCLHILISYSCSNQLGVLALFKHAFIPTYFSLARNIFSILHGSVQIASYMKHKQAQNDLTLTVLRPGLKCWCRNQGSMIFPDGSYLLMLKKICRELASLGEEVVPLFFKALAL